MDYIEFLKSEQAEVLAQSYGKEKEQQVKVNASSATVSALASSISKKINPNYHLIKGCAQDGMHLEFLKAQSK